MPLTVVLLTSSTCQGVMRNEVLKMKQLLELRGVPHITLDASGADGLVLGADKPLREKLFQIAEVPSGTYPLVFLRTKAEEAAPAGATAPTAEAPSTEPAEDSEGEAVEAPAPVDEPTLADSYTFLGGYATLHRMNETNAESFDFDRAFATVPGYCPLCSQEVVGGDDTDSAAGPGRPAGGEGAAAAGAASSSCGAAPAPAVTDPRGNSWTSHVDAYGARYWHCTATGESSWVDPRGGAGPDGAWVAMWTPFASDGTRRQYFYNRRTGESAWSLPGAARAGGKK